MNDRTGHEILVTGLVVVDVLVRLPEKVTPNEKHEVRDLRVTGGGPAGNAAALLASLGWRVARVARVGRDTVGEIARSQMERCGMSDALIIDDPDAFPAISVVEIDPSSGERTVFYNVSRYRFLARSDIPENAVKSAKLVLVDSYETEAAIAMLGEARKHGIPSVLDLEAGDPETLFEILALGEHAILPIERARQLTGEAEPRDVLDGLSRHTKAQLVVTNGARGSWALTSEGVIHQPAFPVEALDTTGCGDAFHGAYASALLDGLSLPLRLEYAAYVAGLVALEFGGQTALPTRSTLAGKDLTRVSPELRAYVQITDPVLR